jgi:hypothetical protein
MVPSGRFALLPTGVMEAPGLGKVMLTQIPPL